jgi:Holliday junction resolvase
VIDAATYFAEAQTEIEFMRHVLSYAKKRGWLYFHTYISKRSTEGFPDIVCVRNGRMVIAELKREKGGRVTPAQREWLQQLRLVAQASCGAVECYLWRPSQWDEIESVLT